MNDFGVVHLVALLGWLILAASAFASYRLRRRTILQLSLTWAGIFVAVALAFSLVMG